MRKRKAPKRKIGRVKNWSPEQLVSNAAEFDANRETLRNFGVRIVDGDGSGVWCTIGARGFHIDTAKLIVDLSGVKYHLTSMTDLRIYLRQCAQEEQASLNLVYRLDKAS